MSRIKNTATGDTLFLSLKNKNDQIASALLPGGNFITIQIAPPVVPRRSGREAPRQR